jgi:glycosyltransferase involved in cell wall biosynthesis
MSPSGGSIVIPAHDEATVIGRTLGTLVAGLPDDVSVVVAANGCSDATAARAREFDRVRVLDLPEPGKTAALRAAEAAVAGELPRIYLDADIELTGRAAAAVLDSLRRGAVAARPPIHFDTTASSWLVRRYCAAKVRIPSVMAELCGGGAYGLSESARGRFESYPDITGDDLFIARIVRPNEVTIVPTDPLVVRMPAHARALLRILRRSVRGNQEFARVLPELARDTSGDTSASLKRQLRDPRTALDAVVYAGFAVAARFAVRFGKPPVRWERDDTSR